MSHGGDNVTKYMSPIYLDFASNRCRPSLYKARALVLGGSNYFQIPNAAEACSFGTGDFTVEFWIYNQNSATLSRLFQSRVGWNIEMGTQKTAFQIGSTYHFDGQTEPPLNEWSHVAFTREGSTLAYWINGLRISTVGGVSDDLTASDPSAAAYLGTFGTVNPLAFYHTGKVQGFHIVKGVALYDYSRQRENIPKRIISNSNTTLLLDTMGTTVPFIESGPHGYEVSNAGGTSIVEELAITPSTYFNYNIGNNSNSYGVINDSSGPVTYNSNGYYEFSNTTKTLSSSFKTTLSASFLRMSLWIRRTGDVDDDSGIFWTTSNNSTEGGLKVYKSGSKYGFKYRFGTNTVSMTDIPTGAEPDDLYFPLNEWVLIVFEMSYDTVNKYINHRKLSAPKRSYGSIGGNSGNMSVTGFHLGGTGSTSDIANNLQIGSVMMTTEPFLVSGGPDYLYEYAKSLWNSQSGRFQ